MKKKVKQTRKISSGKKIATSDDVRLLYEIQYDYLRESKDYKEYCDYVYKHDQRPSDLFRWWEYNEYHDPLLPEKFKCNSNLHEKVRSNYVKFHDVHRNTFEQWWDGFRTYDEQISAWKQEMIPLYPYTITNPEEFISRDPELIEEIESAVSVRIGTDKSLDNPYKLNLVVDIVSPLSELIIEFKKLIQLYQGHLSSSITHPLHINDLRHRDPRRFKLALRAYRMHEKDPIYPDKEGVGKSWKEIGLLLYFDEKKCDIIDAVEAAEERARKEAMAAGKVIKYVEQGIFPYPPNKSPFPGSKPKKN